MTTNGTLYRQVEALMRTSQVQNKLTSWLEQAESTKTFIKNHQGKFNEWAPLKFYVTLGSKKVFSIRYKGQEVATLSCLDNEVGGPTVKISKRQKEINAKYFQFSCESQEFKWRLPEGASFRKHFKKTNYDGHSAEHRIESELISGLTGDKIDSKLRNRIAVTFDDFPLQFPVPLSACKGTIDTTTGHLDILGRKKGNVLSVWELKSPRAYGAVVRQAYIYALQIYFMINDPVSGKKWLDLFKIGSESRDVNMEIVIGISKKYTEQAKSDISTLQAEMEVDGIGQLFSWSIANYNADSASDFDAHKTEFTTVSYR